MELGYFSFFETEVYPQPEYGSLISMVKHGDIFDMFELSPNKHGEACLSSDRYQLNTIINIFIRLLQSYRATEEGIKN